MFAVAEYYNVYIRIDTSLLRPYGLAFLLASMLTTFMIRHILFFQSTSFKKSAQVSSKNMKKRKMVRAVQQKRSDLNSKRLKYAKQEARAMKRKGYPKLRHALARIGSEWNSDTRSRSDTAGLCTTKTSRKVARLLESPSSAPPKTLQKKYSGTSEPNPQKNIYLDVCVCACMYVNMYMYTVCPRAR